MSLIMPDPILRFTHCKMGPGQTAQDGWGVTWVWNENQPAAAPYHTPDNLAVSDLANWKNELKIPAIETADLDWSKVIEKAESIDRQESLVTVFMISGIFERLHMLLGFEDALIGFYDQPEAMLELCNALGDHRVRHAQMLVDKLHPDAVLSHDDWGTKYSMFINPDIWRQFIKPQFKKLYDYFHSEGVVVVHHADSFLEPIVQDMVEIGVDIWQGTLPENDIPKLQSELAGKMTLMGGVDASIIDAPGATEEAIRKEARRACEQYGPQGHFIPCATYGEPNYAIFPNVEATVTDEIRRYNQEVYGFSY
jgi:hypothetical protein